MNDVAPNQPSFEQALIDLEQIVHDLEDGRLSLEESLARYERGVGLLKRCYGLLQQAEQRIRVLTGVDESGRAITAPFDPAAAERDAKAGTAPEAGMQRRKPIQESPPSSPPLWPEP
jgi:exodeoxyribonuclease VII small subunit